MYFSKQRVHLSSLAGQKRKQPTTKAVSDSAMQAVEDGSDDRNLEGVWNAAHELDSHQESIVYFLAYICDCLW